MERRSVRYDVVDENENKRKSRLSKNEYLYDEINNKIGVEDIVNIDVNSKINLKELTNINNREDYHKVKDYKSLISTDEKKEEIYFEKSEKKIYDINTILADAKKNRAKYDELEKKRKLKENDYVSLASLEEKEKYKKDIDEEELTDLINTITSHNLLNDIKKAEKELKDEEEKDLFSELLSDSNEAEQNSLEGIAKEFTNYTDKNNADSDIDNSFYTKSLDLSQQDFEFSDELEAERKATLKIVAVVITIILVIAIVAIIILKSKNII